MNCDSVHELLPLYLSGELRGKELADVQLHLRECGPCATAVQADSDLDNALRSAMLEETPDVSAVLDPVHERMAAPWWKRMLPRLVPLRVAVITAIALFALIALPALYVHQAQRNIALAAAVDHYSDLVMLRHPDWDSTPADVTRFLEQQFRRKQDLLAAITPEGASFEKVRLCNLRGTQYAHFVFRTGTVETSVFLLANPEARAAYQAADLRDAQHNLDVAGFSSAGLNGIVVGQHGVAPALRIADRLSKTL